MQTPRRESRPFKPGDRLTADRLNEMSAPPDIVGGRGIRVVRSGPRYTIELQSPQVGARPSFFGIVTAATKPGAAWQWEYTIGEAIKTAAGWAGWTARPNGRSVTARSVSEVGNTATLAGGVDTAGADYPAGFEPIPVPVGVLVLVHVVPLVDGSAVEYWFDGGPTQHDGTCEAAP